MIVLERRKVIGGAAVTEEFWPGFRNSTASYSVGLLSPEVVGDLELREKHGLILGARKGAHFVPVSKDRFFQTTYDDAANRRHLESWSKRDAVEYDRFCRLLEPIVPFLQEQFLQCPPSISSGWRASAVQALLMLRSAGRHLSWEDQKNLFELLTRSCGDFLDDHFETPPLKAMLAFDAITGNYASVFSPGSAYVMLHHVMGQIFDRPGQWGHAQGGMGSISNAIASACRATGRVQIETDCEVKCVLTDADDRAAGTQRRKAVGVELADGTKHYADVVVSNVHPKHLFLDLVDDMRSIDTDFAARIRRYSSGSGSLRINVALSELPRFTCSPDDPLIHHSSMTFAPSLEYIEQAFRDAESLGYARRPVIEMMTPSAYDTTLAPEGKHVASLFCQHMNPRSTDTQAALEAAIQTVDEMAPNFAASIIGEPMALSPLGLQQRFGLVNGDIFHGRLSLSQIWAARPVVGWGAYATPLSNLYLCGSGAHPGGGVTGYPGRNAAAEILRRREP